MLPTTPAGPIQLGFIRDPWNDVFFFLALPVLALAVGFGFHHWLPYSAGAAIALWFTIPHHYAGWMRTYGLRESRQRWRWRLILAPLLFVPMVFFGTLHLPLSIGIVILLWDHQHSMMQQYGLARIYDLKADTGTPLGGRLDFWLGVVLYLTLLVCAPLWTEIWVKEAYNWNLPLSAHTVATIHRIAWSVLACFALVYLAHLGWSLRRGARVNPIKYLFLGSSYGLWYVTGWQDSLLLHLVAHRIMHGVQYIAMVYWSLTHTERRTGQRPFSLPRLTATSFIAIGLVYALAFQLLSGMPMDEFLFGLGAVLRADGQLPALGSQEAVTWAAALASSAGLTHYYVDSFSWKIRDPRTREDL